MKISLNTPILNQSFGGGMSFAIQLKDFLEDQEVCVVDHLDEDDIDIILHLNVTYTFCYTFYAAYHYKLTHPNTAIVLRINDSGIQRDNDVLGHLMTQCSQYSDYLVYNSHWVQQVMYPRLKAERPFKVIHNGGDSKIFMPLRNSQKRPSTKLKIVTHHWSSNYNKGHDIYQQLDDLIGDKVYQDKYEFTYIGNVPEGLSYQNTKVIPALSKSALGQELQKHHIYLTASRNEAGPMHVIEGALSGLPLLFINSGGTPEYARGFGIEYSTENFCEKLDELASHYEDYRQKMKHYDKTGEKMLHLYFNLFETLVRQHKNDTHSANRGSTLVAMTRLRIMDKLYKYHLKVGPFVYRKRLNQATPKLRDSEDLQFKS
jgi:hypothetical protein